MSDIKNQGFRLDFVHCKVLTVIAEGVRLFGSDAAFFRPPVAASAFSGPPQKFLSRV